MSAKRRILVVDDDAMLREMFTIILEQANYEVIVASDGVSGVEASLVEIVARNCVDARLRSPRIAHDFLLSGFSR